MGGLEWQLQLQFKSRQAGVPCKLKVMIISCHTEKHEFNSIFVKSIWFDRSVRTSNFETKIAFAGVYINLRYCCAVY